MVASIPGVREVDIYCLFFKIVLVVALMMFLIAFQIDRFGDGGKENHSLNQQGLVAG